MRLMVAVVAVETLLLVLLLVLVAGLLRSHAEILRRLGPPGNGGGGGEGGAASPQLGDPHRAPVAARIAGAPAPPLVGATPAGDAVALGFEGGAATPTLLAFLSSGCSSCAGFWEGLGDRRLSPSVQTVIVTHDSNRERPSRLRSLAPAGVPVVMSSQAWADYGVPGSPYFVLVAGVVQGEGVATSWPALASLVADAIEDQHEADGASRARRIDETLAAGGIGPGHESLRPRGTSLADPVAGAGPPRQP